jgi:hypothetical protein
VRRLLIVVIILAAAVYAAQPPAARALPPLATGLAAPVRGAIHVHTRRSDGTGTIQSVARAAERAGLDFVIVTDHGDASRPPDPPTYYGRALVIDAVELSTEGGHVVAIGLGKTPYPIAGEPRDVIDDIRRFGGFSIIAHPLNDRPEAQWRDWNAPFDGLEWLNLDSEWRDESAWLLARVAFAYPVRRAESLGLLLDRSNEAMRRWDERTRTRRVVAVAAADAHARVGFNASEPYQRGVAVPVPGYESLFRTFSIALPDVRLTSNAAADAQGIVGAIRAGRVFSSVDAIAARPAFTFTATSGAARAVAGDTLPTAGPVRLEIRAQAPDDAEIVLLRDGAHVASARGASLTHDADPAAAVYRAEVRLPGGPGDPPVPWIVSNPIYVGRTMAETASTLAPEAPAAKAIDLYTDGPAPNWVIEHSSGSQGAIDVVKAVEGTQLLVRFAVSGAASSHPYVALVAPTGQGIAESARVTFRIRAERPMRVSVQLRAPGSDATGERWHRSLFVDTTPRDLTVVFDDMRPRGRTTSARPPLDKVQSIMWVVDTVNTAAGTSGQFSLDEVRYAR